MRDDQADQPVDLDRWRDLVAAVLAAERVDGPGEVTVAFVDAPTIAELNETHLGGDGPTDVLSFPIDGNDDLAAGDERLVGDIVICPAVAAANAPGHAGDYVDEMALLLVHGCLHLVGHDHAEADDRRRMWARERELLVAHHGTPVADPWAESS